MATYRVLYFRLFGAVGDAVEALERGETVRAVHLLVSALRETEEAHLQTDILPEK